MKRFTLLIINLLWHFTSHAQVSHAMLQGDWVQEGSIPSLSLPLFFDQSYGIQYIQLSVIGDAMHYSTNPVDLRKPFRFTLIDDTLKYNKNAFYVKRISDDHIQLKGVTELAPLNFYRIKRDSIISPAKSANIYAASNSLMPRFKGEFVNFFFSKAFIAYAPKFDKKIETSFTVQIDGSISDISIKSEHSSIKKTRFRRSILRSQPYWIPAKLSTGKSVATRVSLEIIQTGYRTLKNHFRAEGYFFSGVEVANKRPYEAIPWFTKAIATNPKNSKYYFFRANAYYQLLNEQKMCEDLAKAKALCPFLPLGIIDYAQGWQIDCLFQKP
jgi:tetratricopeptide (TPR) repeat protein